MSTIVFTPKEIHIIVQLIAAMIEADLAFEYATKHQLELIKNKLQNVKD